ncbi:MAG: hypothetical protein WKG00_26425 [Polyangiaceae bacterium]
MPSTPRPDRKAAAPTALASLASLASWQRASASARSAAVRALLVGLGSGFAARPGTAGSHALPVIEHQPTSIQLVAVPGGAFRMGLRADELAAVLRMVSPESAAELRAVASIARPVHRVRVAPFLCARAPLLVGQAERLVGALDEDVARPDVGEGERVIAYLSRREAKRAARRLGWQVIAEAQWEYLARDAGDGAWIGEPLRSADPDDALAVKAFCKRPALEGRPSRGSVDAFGVWGLMAGEWTADAWHDTYDGAPRRAVAWSAGAAPALGVVRAMGCSVSWPWQSDEEILGCHASTRSDGRGADQAWALRLVLPIPGVERPARRVSPG